MLDDKNGSAEFQRNEFAGNIVIIFFWENKCGYLKKGNMHNIVTSGVGLFGPNMRVGTKSEICDVSICFN